MSWGIRSCYLDRRTDGLVYHKQKEKTKEAYFFCFDKHKQTEMKSFVFQSYKKQKQIVLFIKPTEIKSFVYKTNINQQKRTALLAKPNKQTETNNFVYKNNRNKQKTIVLSTKPTETKSFVYPKLIKAPCLNFPHSTHSSRFELG